MIKALISKFGAESVSIGNKCININSNSYHVNADVVPCFQYRNYRYIGSRSSEKFVEGIKFFTSNGNYEVINYPKVQIITKLPKVIMRICCQKFKRKLYQTININI